eukprot:TRINITY_DN1915_c2_g1_i1.p1 TRINITY_DN1915_c2_g1~~TRINITY_DN1915_c2_g1_i1.p1  ORF type:complete len:365 (-),score=91.96 TRINITY_DN1915_c2_g1_i1:52-1146(-)
MSNNNVHTVPVHQSLEANQENYFFKEVTTKNVRNAWLIGIGVLIITGLSWALYFILNAPHTTITGTEFTFQVGPISIAAGQRNISYLIGTDRPTELQTGTVCAFTYFKFALVDELGVEIPMEQVYVSQLSFFEEVDPFSNSIRILASQGDEANKPATNLGTTNAVRGEPDRDWGLKWNFFNIWGAASNAPIDVYIKVTLRYTPLKSTTNFNWVEWDMLGVDSETSTSVDNTFNVPGTGGIISKEVSGIFLDDTIVVMAWGNLNIGGINISVYHGTDNIPFATSKVSYAANGYIASSERQSNIKNTFVALDSYRLLAYYDNSKPYANATALVGVYRTVANTTSRSLPQKSVKYYMDHYFTDFDKK